MALPLLALAAILAYFLFRKSAEVPVVTVATPTPTLTPVTAPTVSQARRFCRCATSQRKVLRIPSLEVRQALAFIQDPARMVDKETWFSFDRLEFRDRLCNPVAEVRRAIEEYRGDTEGVSKGQIEKLAVIPTT
jgi:hypothetical protein